MVDLEQMLADMSAIVPLYCAAANDDALLPHRTAPRRETAGRVFDQRSAAPRRWLRAATPRSTGPKAAAARAPAGRWVRLILKARSGSQQSRLMTTFVLLAMALPISAGMARDPGMHSEFGHLATMPFYPALLFAALLSGRKAAWTVTLGALVVEAFWMLMSGEIEPEHAPFFGEFAATLLLSAFAVSWFDWLLEWVSGAEPARSLVPRHDQSHCAGPPSAEVTSWGRGIGAGPAV
jgi:hypothetical protein